MKLKRYDSFLIKESFSSSSEYYDFIGSNKIEKDFFFDNLLEVDDIPGVKTHFYTSVIDSSGKVINDEVKSSETYRIHYTILIEYWFLTPDDHKFDKFTSQLSHLNTIKNSIEEMIDRVSDKVKLDKNEVKSTGKLTFVIGFTQEMDNKELIKSFNIWYSHTGAEYQEGIKKLRKIYQNAPAYIVGSQPIDLDKYLTTNDDDEDYTLIGFFGDDEEIYGIADYDKKTKKFGINKQEIADSIRGHFNLR